MWPGKKGKQDSRSVTSERGSWLDIVHSDGFRKPAVTETERRPMNAGIPLFYASWTKARPETPLPAQS